MLSGPRLHLSIRRGTQTTEREVPPAEGPITLGRAGDNAVVLEDPGCSRRHAEIRCEGGGWRIRDLGSNNGTHLNGEILAEERALSAGDRITLGGTEVLVALEDLPPRPRQGRPSWVLPLGVAAAAALLLIAWTTSRPQTRREGSRPVPASPSPKPDKAAITPAALPIPDGWAGKAQAALEALRAEEKAGAQIPQLIQRCRDLSRSFPDTQEAAEALDTLRSLEARLGLEQETRVAAVLEAAEEAARTGGPPAARACLTCFLEEGGVAPVRLYLIQKRLAALDTEMEQDFSAASERALQQVQAGQFAEARGALEALKARYAGLPWGSAAEARLSELKALESQQAEENRRLTEDGRSEEERARLRVEWRDRQGQFTALLSGLPLKRVPQRRALFQAIASFDTALEKPTIDALERAHKSALNWLKNKLHGDAVQRIRRGMEGDLAGCRKAALTLIHDAVRYPYPYGPDGNAKVNKEVADLVKAVEDIYKPAMALARTLHATQGFDTLLDNLEELESDLTQAGRPQPREKSVAGLLEKMVPIDLGKEAEADKVNAQILADVEADFKRMKEEGTLNAEEFSCIQITNRYRIMMGMAPLRIEPKLVKASRGHSADMAARNYFAHVDPFEGKGPGDRAKAAGFTGGCGENIHSGQGSGAGAFEGWKHSSGHHRNMLTRQWTCIGVGQSGNLWTMMLGS